MWYDAQTPEKQEPIKEILTGSNPEKDHQVTRHFLNTMMKHAAVFDKAGHFYRLGSHTRENEHQEIRKALTQTKAKNTLEIDLRMEQVPLFLLNITKR